MNEKLSALMDGELARDEAHIAIKTLGADGAQREHWDAWHLIGACMRGENASASAPASSLRNPCAEAIFAKLAAEPTVLAPAAIKRPATGERRTRMALAMAASVVTVSAVGVIALKQQQGSTVAPVNLVQKVAPQPVGEVVAQRATPDVRVNDYLVVHRQFANPGALQQAALGHAPAREAAPAADAGKQAAGR